MQSHSGQSRHSDKCSKSEPIHGYGSVGVFAVACGSGSFELEVSRTRLGVLHKSRFDVTETAKSGALEFLGSDAAHLSSTWGWSRPSHETFVLGDNTETEFGFESFDGGPVGSEDANRIYDFDAFMVELNSWLDKKQPHTDIDEGKNLEQVQQLALVGAQDESHNSNQVHNATSNDYDYCNSGANDLHSNDYSIYSIACRHN